MKKSLLVMSVLVVFCVSLVFAAESEEDHQESLAYEEGYDPSQEGFDWESNNVELTEGDNVVLPPDYAGEVNVVPDSEVEIPEGFSGTVNIKDGDVILPDGELFTGTGSYKDGKLIMEDGTFIGFNEDETTFSGSGSYEDGIYTITEGTIEEGKEIEYSLTIKARNTGSVRYENGEVIGAAIMTEEDATKVITTSNTVYSKSGKVSSSDGELTTVTYTVAGEAEYDITVKPNLRVPEADLSAFKKEGVKFDPQYNPITEISVGDVTYRDIDELTGSRGMITIKGDALNGGQQKAKVTGSAAQPYFEIKISDDKKSHIVNYMSESGETIDIKGGKGKVVAQGERTQYKITSEKNQLFEEPIGAPTPSKVIINTPTTTATQNKQAGLMSAGAQGYEPNVVILADNSEVYDKYRINPPQDDGGKKHNDPMKKLKQDLLRDFIERLKRYEQGFETK